MLQHRGNLLQQRGDTPQRGTTCCNRGQHSCNQLRARESLLRVRRRLGAEPPSPLPLLPPFPSSAIPATSPGSGPCTPPGPNGPADSEAVLTGTSKRPTSPSGQSCSRCGPKWSAAARRIQTTKPSQAKPSVLPSWPSRPSQTARLSPESARSESFMHAPTDHTIPSAARGSVSLGFARVCRNGSCTRPIAQPKPK